MKRSERFAMKARHAAGMAACMFSVCVAGCVWLLRGLMEVEPVAGGLLLLTSAVPLGCLCLAVVMGREACRYARQARRERRWEEELGRRYAKGEQCWG